MNKKSKIYLSLLLSFLMIVSIFVCVSASKTSDNSKITIHFYSKDWSNPNIYYWNSLPSNKEVDWPGKEMESEGDSWYKYEFSDVTKINFLFNENGEQTEDLTRTSGEWWYKDGKFTDTNPDEDDNKHDDDKKDDDKKDDDKKDDDKKDDDKQDDGTYKKSEDFRDESIYFVITTRFYDGYKENNVHCSDENSQTSEDDPAWRGDFQGLIDKLDYIKALGFSAIWITPVVENKSGLDYHGYHAYNFSKVDSRYESPGATYQDLIDACHKKGIRLIQDVVYNHTSNWGEENIKQLTEPVYKDRNKIVMNGNGDPNNLYHHNGFCGSGDYDNYGCQIKTIADDCFDLNTENPTVYNYLNECYTKYINMGVDAFRIDTVKHISRLTFNKEFIPAIQKAGGDKFFMFGEICTKGHDVWYRDAPPISTCFYTWEDTDDWLSRWSDTDEAANQSLVAKHYDEHLDKSKQPTSNNAFLDGNDYHEPDYSQSSGMNAIDFQMHWSFQDAGQAFSVAKQEDQYFNDSTKNVVYVDSHDYGPDFCYDKRYTGGTDTWAENLDLMFTFRGIPCIYYGSEIEFQKGQPIDKGNCAPLAETGRAYYGDHLEGEVTATDFGKYTASGAVADTLNSTLSRHIQKLNLIRRAIPALRRGQYSTEGINGNMAYKRRYTNGNTDSFVCVTISGGATFTGIPNGDYVDAVTGDKITVSDNTLDVKCEGKANMRVYVLNGPGQIGGDVEDDYLK